MHASEVTSEDPTFCEREWALYDKTGRRPREVSITAASEVTFSLGRMYQELFTGWLGDMAVGHWECLGCKATYEFCKQPTCCGVGFRYVEVRFISRESGTSCGVDVLVDLPTREKFLLTEVKSLKQDEFKKLVMPLAEHRARTSFYLRIVAESGDVYKKVVDSTEARIVYISKGGWGQKDLPIMKWKVPHDGPWSPFKEFVIGRDDDLTKPYHDRARRLHLFRQGGPMPEGICGTQFTKRAKGCPVVGSCFSGKFPPGAQQ